MVDEHWDWFEQKVSVIVVEHSVGSVPPLIYVIQYTGFIHKPTPIYGYLFRGSFMNCPY